LIGYLNGALKQGASITHDDVRDLGRFLDLMDIGVDSYTNGHSRSIRSIPESLKRRGDIQFDPELYLSLERVTRSLSGAWRTLGYHGQRIIGLLLYAVSFWVLIPLAPLDLDDNTKAVVFAFVLIGLLPVLFRGGPTR
jgi:hypothetical protein